MKNTATIFILGLALVSESIAQNPNKASVKRVEAVVIKIIGTVLFREGPEGQIQKLTSKNAAGKLLHAGDELRVEGNGEVLIELSQRKPQGDTQVVITKELDWYPIPEQTILNTPNPPLLYFRKEFAPGGRRRGQSSIILL